MAERKRGHHATDSRATVSTAEGRVTAPRNAGARRRRLKKQEMPPSTKRAEVRKSATSVGEEHLARKHCGLCRSLEHRTRDCDKRGAQKGAVPAKLNVPGNQQRQ